METEYKYRMEVSWSPIDGAWVVLVPDLPGCFADGPTAIEAIQNAREVIGLWLETAQDEGRDIPAPSYYQPTPPANAPTAIS